MGEKIKPICYIFGGYLPEFSSALVGEITDKDFVICADRGLEAAINNGIKPDLIIGDFDSFSGDIPKDTEVITLPIEKDDTDLNYAAKEGLKRGFDNFILSGVTGGRLDMTAATVSTLLYLFKNSSDAKVLDKSVSMYVTQSDITLKKPAKASHLSVFPINGSAEGVSISGAVYSAENLTLTADFPIGVSNSFKDSFVKISVKKGTLLIMVVSKD